MAKTQPQQTVVSVQAPRQNPGRLTDAPRDERRATVRVRFRDGVGSKAKVAAGLRIVAKDAKEDGWVYPPPIYESDVDELMALVETDARLLQTAESAHQQKFEKYCTKYIDGAGPDADRQREDLARRYPGSVEAEFFSIANRGIFPFADVEVIKTGLPAPETEAERQMRALLDRVMPAQGGASQGQIQALLEQNAEMRAELDELKGMVTAPASPESETKMSGGSGRPKPSSK
jgi:hypothetical protein